MKITNYELRITNEEKRAEAERSEGMAQLLRAKERAGEESGIRNYELGMEEESRAAEAAEPLETGFDEQEFVSGNPVSGSEEPPAVDEGESLAARLRKRRNL